MSNDFKCTDWKAVLDLMPPGPHTLRVSGKCTFPTPGFTVTFKHHHPQGINPKVLLLDKIVKPPTGIEPQIVTTIPVHYEEKTGTKYTDVEILPGGPQIKVEIVT